MSKQKHLCATTGKIPYPTRLVARQAARAYAHATGHKFDAYQCRICQKWHIGHSKHQGKRGSVTY